MKRREFVTLLGGTVATWPLAVHAQQQAMPVIGFLGSTSLQGYSARLRAFGQGLKEEGYIDGQNVAIEYRFAEDHDDRLPALAAELVHREVKVIAAGGSPASVAAKAATATIPIVFETASDPVQLGLVASLDRPGGNVTGITNLNIEVAPKRLQLLHELIPNASVFALLVNPANPTLAETNTKGLQAAARDLGLELQVLNASTEGDFDAVFAKLVELRAGGLVIGDDPFFVGHIKQLAALSVRHGLPAAHDLREFVAPAA